MLAGGEAVVAGGVLVVTTGGVLVVTTGGVLAVVVGAAGAVDVVEVVCVGVDGCETGVVTTRWWRTGRLWW